jgi:hypothetical protein
MRPFIDSLEDRRLFAFVITDGQFHIQVPVVTTLSAGVTLKVSKTGTLFVTGTGKADKVTFQVKNGKIVAGELAAADSAAAASFTFVPVLNSNTKIKRVDVSGLGGNDVITVFADVPVSVRGAAGNDTINVFAPTRTIVGGSGSNMIRDGDEAVGDVYLYSTGTYTPLQPLSTGTYAPLQPLSTGTFTPLQAR